MRIIFILIVSLILFLIPMAILSNQPPPQPMRIDAPTGRC